MADPGAMLANGTPLFTLVDDSVLEFRASVPSADYGKVRGGRRRRRHAWTRSRAARVQGKVARVSPLVDERTRSFEVVVEVPGRQRPRGRPVRPGDRCRVGQVDERARRAAGRARARRHATPAGRRPSWCAEGKAERMTVTLGVETADAIQVTSGLAGGRHGGARPAGGARLRAPPAQTLAGPAADAR